MSINFLKCRKELLKFLPRYTKLSFYKNEFIVFLFLFTISSSIVTFQFLTWETSAERIKFKSLALFSGDEPSYLEVTSSIVRFHSLALDASFTSPVRDPFFEWPPLYYEVNSCRLHESLTAADGHCYMQNIGLPLIIAPGYYIAGVVGSMLTLSSLFSIQGVIFYKISNHFTTRSLSLFLAILVSVATILLPFSSRIYPDFVGGFFIFTAFYFFFFRKNNFLNLSITGFLLGFLPFLKSYFLLFPIIWLPIMVFVLFKKHRYNNIFHVTASFSILLLIYFSLAIVIAPVELSLGVGGDYKNFLLSFINSFSLNDTATAILHGLQGTLFEQTSGLLIYSSLALLSIFGIKYVWNYNKILSFSIILAVFSFIMTFGIVDPYGAGWSLPSRYTIPILPILLIPLFPLFEKFKKNIILHFIVLGCSYVSVSLNIIFARTIYEHFFGDERVRILNDVYFGLVKDFPRMQNNASQGLSSPSGPVFLIFIIILISFFVFFTFSSIIRKAFQIKNRKILFFVLVFVIYGSVFYYSYNIISTYNIESEISNIFDETLKRQPTNEEMIYWKNLLSNDKITPNEMKNTLANSEEGQITSKISELYEEFLNREPDTVGLNLWKGEILNKEINFTDLEYIIKNSPEAMQLKNAK